MKLEAYMDHDKETKNTVRYRAADEASEAVMEYAYIKKTAVGEVFPQRVVITVEAE